jgi:hypothetical protein
MSAACDWHAQAACDPCAAAVLLQWLLRTEAAKSQKGVFVEAVSFVNSHITGVTAAASNHASDRFGHSCPTRQTAANILSIHTLSRIIVGIGGRIWLPHRRLPEQF